ncbi:hypothetical protein GZH46_00322 [Fragariocoptes setiger]|uniref:Uncharacterized protein n=1 Tax=Fragariocoptes setiger TaxID=1670756 RepID=A0ABQ7SCF8_9ACAR|nr:hypothetical protein GZH46_00322 [Fragariocoptes setiger]
MYTSNFINEIPPPMPASSVQLNQGPVQSPNILNLTMPWTIGNRNMSPLSPQPMTHVPQSMDYTSATRTDFIPTGAHAIRYPPGFPQDRMFIIEKYFKSLIECDLLDLSATQWPTKPHSSDIRTPSDNVICSMSNNFIATDEIRPMLTTNVSDNVNLDQQHQAYSLVNYANSSAMLINPAPAAIIDPHSQYFHPYKETLDLTTRNVGYLNSIPYSGLTSDDNGFCSGTSMNGMIGGAANYYYNIAPSPHLSSSFGNSTSKAPAPTGSTATRFSSDSRNYLGGSCRSITKSSDTNAKSTSGRGRRRPSPIVNSPLPEDYSSREVMLNACRKYGVRMKISPPPIPESRNYTVANGRKIRFPQTRRLNADWCGSTTCMKLFVGDIVRVLGPSQGKRGHFRVESPWPEQVTATIDLPYSILDGPEKVYTS